ncbi:sialidase family protein [Coraliomargarita parva]|uniref:sialidase family protein n=1 Tax=Coraliomargarita parva TaxID=3014050 RepID=UPI0022B481D2|nr:sialidase family protein [Coraliomargarita parva]
MPSSLETEKNPSVVLPPPGSVINHSYVKEGRYIGSPSIAKLEDGAYVASHDFFGPETKEHEAATTLIFRSDDQGQSWKEIASITPAFWSGLLAHQGALYLFGPTHHHGHMVIRRSDDGGYTWTEPKDTRTGLLTPFGQYHTAPTAFAVYNGRLWRAIEDASGSTRWGERYNPVMMSAPVGADLLRRDSWQFTPVLRHSKEWLDGKFGGWLEGNAVVLPNGQIGDILRVDYNTAGKAAIVSLDDEGQALRFDPELDLIDLPGGATKFTIRHDPESGLYWTLSNAVPAIHSDCEKQTFQRNTLALLCSEDARKWEIRYVVLYHPDPKCHGFQYVDWLFEGDDIIAVSRTAWDDDQGGAKNQHDANFLTFHRIGNFRNLTLADSKQNPFT